MAFDIKIDYAVKQDSGFLANQTKTPHSSKQQGEGSANVQAHTGIAIRLRRAETSLVRLGSQIKKSDEA